MYDTLTRWDTALQLQPGLATSWKTVNETTWEFTLRPGVKFHDGAPFTAEDVKATLDRNMVPGKTVVTPGFTTIEAVQIVSPSVIRILTKRPDPLSRRMQMGSQILPARLTTDEGVRSRAPPGRYRAYRFVEWVKDERLAMQANHEWWMEGKTPEGAGDRAHPGALRIVALEKGDVDIITNVPPDRMKGIAEAASRVSSRRRPRVVALSTNSPSFRPQRVPGPRLCPRRPPSPRTSTRARASRIAALGGTRTSSQSRAQAVLYDPARPRRLRRPVIRAAST
jgi:ABC-type transport system substrate-binding protein